MPAGVRTSPVSREETTCCVVGGGPAGMMLAYLLARQEIPVTLLEAHDDFDREFRGDTLHSSVMENLAQLGLSEKVLEICHARLRKVRFLTQEAQQTIASFDRLASPFPFIAMVPQADFLGLLAGEARRLPCFRLRMGANARRLIEDDGRVRGVVYRSQGQLHELRATLTVGADGRGSRLRRLAGLELTSTAPPMDVLWFRLPRSAEDAEVASVALRFGHGTFMVLLDRREHWQVGYVILKGGYRELRRRHIQSLRDKVVELIPEFRYRVESLEDWSQVSILSVQTGRLERWYKDGLLLLGDAAHVMSPVGGVGINYAIQDAVAAANLLTEPLRSGAVEPGHLAAVQRRREWPTRVIQGAQAFIQKRVVSAALRSERPFRLPLPVQLMLKVPVLRTIPARLIAYGVRPERIR